MTRAAAITRPDLLKFRLLSEGIAISADARIRLDELRGERDLTPADYASTTGLILRLEDDVWVNAPFGDFNPEFVHSPQSQLRLDESGAFRVECDEMSSRAWVWLPPRYHGRRLSCGLPANDFVFTHGDRVRLAPIGGCALGCRFCGISYEDDYRLKPVGAMIEALRLALSDPLQPARHVLISGGTPVPSDVPYLRAVYERVLEAFPEVDVDIMMGPVEGLFDLGRLKELGLNELSVNIELVNHEISRELMPQKHRWGMDRYLALISQAAEVLGPGKVRSMLLVGLEPAEDTLAGVRAVLDAGGTPVLSPFRPDGATPLRGVAPLSAQDLLTIYTEAADMARQVGTQLGPTCPPCTHNTLTLVRPGRGEASYRYPAPVLV